MLRLIFIALPFVVGPAFAADPLVFAVTEGSSYRVSAAETKLKYDSIGEDLSKLLHRKVQLEPVSDYSTLATGLAAKRYDLAYIHPAQVSIRALRTGNYSLMALTKGYLDYRVTFFVPTGSKAASLADVKGRKVALPERDSITAWLVRATFRDMFGAGAGDQDMTYTRYQDAIPFMVEHGLVEIGASSSADVLGAWSQQGGKLIGTSKAMPIKHLIAAKALPADQFKIVQDYFLNLEGTDAGRSRLEHIQVKGFVGFEEPVLLKMGTWLGI